MKLRLKKLNQRGFDHVMAVVAFVVLFAVIGTALIVSTHATTATSYVQLRLNNNNVCLTGENIATCNTSDREMLFVKPVAGSSNFLLKNAANLCVDDWNHAYQSKTAAQGGTRINARLNTCYSNDKNQQWSWRGTGNHELANAGNNYQGCLNSAGALTANNNPVIIYACNNSWNENWIEHTATLNTSTTPTTPTWTLTGTTSYTVNAQGTITYKNTIKNIGSKATGSFKYGPRFFYSSTANPAINASGTYPGEITQGADSTHSALNAGASFVINQAAVVPQSKTSGYACEAIAFSPRTSTGLTNGRSVAACVNIANLR